MEDIVITEGKKGKKESVEDILEKNLFGSKNSLNGHEYIPEILIAADEFNTFVGNGNIEFLSMLGVLWDWEGPFRNKVKNSRSVELNNPYVSILAGNTATGFSLAFPTEAIGQGIFSRLVLVHGEATGKKITFPRKPTPAETKEITGLLQAVRVSANGAATLTPSAEYLLDTIYKSGNMIPDVRFESYSNRRFTHLIKLCLVISAASLRNEIRECDVLYANTILTHAEHSMGKALGEFGKARHSEVSNKLVQILEGAILPMTLKEIWMQLHNDLDDISTLKDMLTNLVIAEKVLSTKQGFLVKRKILEETGSKYVDFSLLTEEERKYIS